MFYNGLLLGVIGVACQQHGMALDLWSFVAPHGSLELPSIISCRRSGTASWRMACFFPGLYRRRESIAQAGVEATRLVAGIIPLLVIAGTLEGFFSPSAASVWLKFAVGGDAVYVAPGVVIPAVKVATQPGVRVRRRAPPTPSPALSPSNID